MTFPIDMVPKTANGSSVHAAAYKLAVTELEAQGQPNTEAMRDEIVTVILELVKAGQRDPILLSRHAVSRVLVGV